MSDAIGSANGIDLNSASEQQLEHVGGLGRERAHRIVENRPFGSFEDLKKIDFFSEKLVQDLKNSGATLGNRHAA